MEAPWTSKVRSSQDRLSSSSNLLLSTESSSHILITSPDVTLAPLCNQIESRATLAAGIVPDTEILATVSAGGLELWSDLTNGERVGSWTVSGENEVVAAAISGNFVAIGRKGAELAILELRGKEIEHLV